MQLKNMFNEQLSYLLSPGQLGHQYKMNNLQKAGKSCEHHCKLFRWRQSSNKMKSNMEQGVGGTGGGCNKPAGVLFSAWMEQPKWILGWQAEESPLESLSVLKIWDKKSVRRAPFWWCDKTLYCLDCFFNSLNLGRQDWTWVFLTLIVLKLLGMCFQLLVCGFCGPYRWGMAPWCPLISVDTPQRYSTA